MVDVWLPMVGLLLLEGDVWWGLSEGKTIKASGGGGGGGGGEVGMVMGEGVWCWVRGGGGGGR